MPKTQFLINSNQIQFFIALFNRGGYVLNFSTSEFDRFTLNSVDVALCQKYQLSKGKSLEKFCSEEEESKVVKLLRDLLSYYEAWFNHEIDREDVSYNRQYSALYNKCKEIIDGTQINNLLTTLTTNQLKDKFSSEYLTKQIDLMISMKDSNPTEAIGKSKELIETCCKDILEHQNYESTSNMDVNTLIKKTMEALNIHADHISDEYPEAKTIKKILGSLSGVASGISELRNSYGSGHGKNISYRGLTSRHADLAIGASVTLVKYFWDTYEWKESKR